MRTYRREDVERAQAAWADYGAEWAELRRAAAERGMLFPPAGTRLDVRDEPRPSQRVIVWRALDERPTQTLAIVGGARSWSQVVARILVVERELRSDADDAEDQAETTRRDGPSRGQAMATVSEIFARAGKDR